MTQQQIDKFVELAAETGKVLVATDVYECLEEMLTFSGFPDWLTGIGVIKDKYLGPGTMIAYREPKPISLNLEAQDWLR